MCVIFITNLRKLLINSIVCIEYLNIKNVNYVLYFDLLIIMETINERIERIVRYFAKTRKEFAAKVGKSNQWVTNITSPNFPVGKKTILSITEAYPEINPEWLALGIGEMLLSSVKNMNTLRNEVIPIPEDHYMMVEYADLRASAGILGGADVSQLPETRTRLLPKEYSKGGFLVVGVDGDSMDDGTKRSLCNGDEVLIHEKKDCKLEDLPIKKSLFVITTREGNVLKQIAEVNTEKKYITCHSFNPTYEDFQINFDDIYQIFIVCKITQKQISLI